ncbi:hypothetical protein TELCIR_10906 [Teladorsagia circumcincta]|uniref:Uncharacterized protein n=1 Tax=Teladorsagia circumcincta TaxID=45464 RepID=A0A2G9UD21_TELCI|nr:hypothetical protein TELCIR_10906 [Teladorsagia circumcincta]
MIRQKDLDMQQLRALGKARETVVTAIQQLRKQFPILDGIIKLPMAKVAKVVVLCTALYNLTRTQGEPFYTGNTEQGGSFSKCLE